MDQREGIAEALKVLEGLDPGVLPAAVVVMPPDMGESILGNESGFVQLAIASLKAAQGWEQVFAKQAWVAQDDADWQIHSLKFDDAAHVYLPVKRTRVQEMRNAVVFYAIGGMLIICLALGAKTLLGFVLQLF